MSSENRIRFLATGHPALNWNGAAMVCVCQKGELDGVKALVESHDVEKTGISVGEMISKEGKNSDGKSWTPLQATTDKAIRKYLLGILAKQLVVDYKNEFAKGTTLACACEKGRFE